MGQLLARMRWLLPPAPAVPLYRRVVQRLVKCRKAHGFAVIFGVSKNFAAHGLIWWRCGSSGVAVSSRPRGKFTR